MLSAAGPGYCQRTIRLWGTARTLRHPEPPGRGDAPPERSPPRGRGRGSETKPHGKGVRRPLRLRDKGSATGTAPLGLRPFPSAPAAPAAQAPWAGDGAGAAAAAMVYISNGEGPRGGSRFVPAAGRQEGQAGARAASEERLEGIGPARAACCHCPINATSTPFSAAWT